MPYKSETLKFNLEAVDLPEFEIEYQDPLLLPAGLRNRVIDALAILAYSQKKDDPLPEDKRWSLYAIDDFVRKSLISWNLTFPETWAIEEDQGKVIPMTRKVEEGEPAWNPLDALPAYVYAAIVKEVGDRLLTPPKRAKG